MSEEIPEFQVLQSLLLDRPSGGIADANDRLLVISALAKAWPGIPQSRRTRMSGRKILEPGRAEALHWDRDLSVLEFFILRHGPALAGGRHYERQRWTLRFKPLCVECSVVERQRVLPPDACEAIALTANAIGDAILKRRKYPGVLFRGYNEVVVDLFRVLPSTTVGPRRRLAKKLARRLKSSGWVPAREPPHRAKGIFSLRLEPPATAPEKQSEVLTPPGL